MGKPVKSLLCVGGSKDGQKMLIERDKGYIGFPIRKANFNVVEESYIINKFSGNSKTYEFLLFSKLTPDDLIEKLIEGYKPK
jgi:hypothetical protein